MSTANAAASTIAAVKAGVASIEHGSMLTDEAIALMKEHGTYLVPTTYLVDAIDLAMQLEEETGLELAEDEAA